MTFFEQLERQILTKGHVIVQDKVGAYQIFSHFKDENGNYRISGWLTSIEEAKELIGCNAGNG